MQAEELTYSLQIVSHYGGSVIRSDSYNNQQLNLRRWLYADDSPGAGM